MDDRLTPTTRCQPFCGFFAIISQKVVYLSNNLGKDFVWKKIQAIILKLTHIFPMLCYSIFIQIKRQKMTKANLLKGRDAKPRV
ncbi:hypothetical protein ABE38_14995 [Brevibacillus agri]|nr:hypothetical protein [Brevibacillus agri]